ncbi:putative protein N(5)-glutamine methyltransferase [Leifsonia sp. H3M29-4]|uniref:putative protein N(5)-glutamine methyltransferase n=1 Tax=Salinibacterium metalliresistens TaxID=3031321 RepID=UPI0023DB15A8|nr:putative protein N(5)-glutamine methyltransferase [Salinibacterium metalliresistens]MDF1478824.1 putative protein N(5)-glutamine methyltransferase [Salinibacterium metalliresistens]
MASIVERLRAAGCVFAEDEAALLEAATDDPATLEAMVQRRAQGTPLEVVLGWAEFAGRRILIDDGVFVPRPRTEALVAAAIERGRPGGAVLDLCCGSGAVGLVVAGALGGTLAATDLDPAAVACARRNGVDALLGDLYAPLSPARFDVITLVAPYVPTDDIRLLPREARLFEPPVTLDGGADGLDVVRRAVAGAPAWLASGGWFVTEVSERQADAVAAAIEVAGLVASIVRDDELDTTVAVGHYV